jgi:hypothetical protein
MLNNVLIALTIVVTILSGPIRAFDGNRKGFVLGGGLGIGPSTKLKLNDTYDKNDLGFAVNIVVGYAWNNKNIISLDYNANHFWPEMFGSDTAISVFISPVWYHYYGNGNQSLFSAFGLGRHGLGVKNYDSVRGLGFLLGGGYEFKRHFQVGIYYSGGNVTSQVYPNRSFYIYRVNAILTFVFY